MAKLRQRGQGMRPSVRRGKGGARREGRPVRRVQVTLGDLIAATFDVMGGEARKVTRVMASRAMAQATGRQFVFIG